MIAGGQAFSLEATVEVTYCDATVPATHGAGRVGRIPGPQYPKETARALGSATGDFCTTGATTPWATVQGIACGPLRRMLLGAADDSCLLAVCLVPERRSAWLSWS
jgi:hypothetical protein